MVAISELDKLISTFNQHRYVTGYDAVREMKENNSQWRQMEWIGWYYEYLANGCVKRNTDFFLSPTGNKVYIDYVVDGVLTDLKVHNTLAKNHTLYLNDYAALKSCIQNQGRCNFLLILGESKMDEDGAFVKWHNNLIGKLTNPKGRKRKVDFRIQGYALLPIDASNFDKLLCLKQGKNSNGKPRPPKAGINLKKMNLDNVVMWR